ncbi:hypothetical protein SRHO_G00111830 [Serrasalmus rhombeus]
MHAGPGGAGFSPCTRSAGLDMVMGIPDPRDETEERRKRGYRPSANTVHSRTPHELPEPKRNQHTDAYQHKQAGSLEH